MTLFASYRGISRDDTLSQFKKEKNYRLRERYQAIYLSYSGYMGEQIADILAREINTVRIWIKDFNAIGSMAVRGPFLVLVVCV